jgi:RNA polymerase sigma-70 factor (ECF subfamily)
MDQREWLAEQFEAERAHLRGVAYRMLGSLNEAEDAVQEAWLRLNRSDASGIDSLGAWLTTVVARVCLDMLRSRKSRREDELDEQTPEPAAARENRLNPEDEALLAESVGLALLVVLETLAPAERITFVLHDLFDLPFDQIAPIVGRSPSAARQLASRARRRVRGTAPAADTDIRSQREVVDAFLAAIRAADFEALVKVLDPNVVFRADRFSAAGGAAREVRGAELWAQQAIAYSRGIRLTQAALVDGAVGVIFAPHGRLSRVLRFTIRDGRIAEVDVVGDPEKLRQFELGVLED